MNVSVFDVFKVGVGPSSSHTMGPMLAARLFVLDLEAKGLLEATAEVFVQLYGSLALTGLGHCTDRAILLGLEGHDPSEFDPAVMEPTLARIRGSARIRLLGKREIAFDEPMNLLFHRDQMLPGIRTACASRRAMRRARPCSRKRCTRLAEAPCSARARSGGRGRAPVDVPLPFGNGDELLERADGAGSRSPS